MESKQKQPELYEPRSEYDNCGVGAVTSIKDIRSRRTVGQALHIVENLGHRVGEDTEGKTGDGVGVMLQISHGFFKKATEPLGSQIRGERKHGVSIFFFPQNELIRNQAMKMFEIIVRKEDMIFPGWRVVPIAPEILGEKALDVTPYVARDFVGKPTGMEAGLDFDRKFHIIRRVLGQSNGDIYVVSSSGRTIVYKGMFLAGELRLFFSDPQDEDYRLIIAIVHSKFSASTNPSWMWAHSYRFIVHNGEINTVRGNMDKTVAREGNMESGYFRYDIHKVLLVIDQEGFDPAMLDSALEFTVMSGMDLPLAIMVTIPAPQEDDKCMDSEIEDFYQCYVIMMGPWDGPASTLFTDGDAVGVVLNRNGFHPLRYYITGDGCMILASEVGAIDIDQTKAVKKDRLHLSKMLLVDVRQGRLIGDDELKHYYASRNPYGE